MMADPTVFTLSKRAAAIMSILVSVFLAMVKFAVGVLSGSLAILADAADSFIDLISATITLLAVSIADLPPDSNHPYGHARAENLGTLAQALLLVVTAGWFLWKASERLFIQPAMPDISLCTVIVIIVSLAANIVRVRLLTHTAHQLKSQSLEASAANFLNDMIASLVVLATLAILTLHQWTPLPLWFVERVDALGAVIVAMIALRLAWGLGKRSIYDLMDSVPGDLNDRLRDRISALPDVVPDSAEVRTRFVGEQPFVEVTVGMPRGHSLEEAHDLADTVEDVIRRELEEACVLVHVEPARTLAEPYATTVYAVAQRLGLRVHHLELYQLADKVRVEMDLELSWNMTLAEAHRYSEQLEAAIAAELPCETTVAVHLEPRHDYVQPAVRYTPIDEQVDRALSTLADISLITDIESWLTDDGVIVTLRCQFPGDTLLTDVHRKMASIEQDLLRAMPEIARVQIDPEPCTTITPHDG